MQLPNWYRAESERYLHLDALRFLASAAIVVFHYKDALGFTGALHGLHLAVDLFFVASGVMMGDLYGGRLTSRASYGRFMQKRFARLAPLHYLTLAFFVAFGLLAALLHLASANPGLYLSSRIAPNVLFLHAFDTTGGLSFNGPSWSISAEMGMYALLPVLWIVSRWRLAPALWFAGLAGLFLLDATGGGREWLEWTYDGGVIRALPSFLLGLWLSKADLTRIPRPELGLLACVAGFAVGAAFLPNAALLMLGWGCVVFALATDRQKIASPARLIAPLGRLTYSLYMLHMPVLVVLGTVVGKKFLHLESATYAAWVVLLGFIVLPAASWLSLTTFETWGRHLLSRQFKSSQSPEPLPVR